MIEQEELWDLIRKICPQLPGESAKAYQAFADTAFSGLSVRRLLDRYKEVSDLIAVSYDIAIAPPPTLKLNTLFTWSKKNQWQQRLKSWQSIHEAYKRKLAGDRERANLARWNNTRTKFLDRLDNLLGKADEMLKFPIIGKTVKRKIICSYVGQEIEQEVVIYPAKWQFRDAALFYKLGFELLSEVVGDRERAIDKLHADGYLIVDPNSGDDSAFEKHLAALKTLEEIGI